MTTTTQTTNQGPKVGDVFIIRKDNEAPTTTNVDRVTKTGQVYLGNLNIRFKPSYNGSWEPTGCDKFTARKYTAWPHTDAKLAELIASHEYAKGLAEQRAAEKKANQDAREALEAEQGRTVRHLMANTTDRLAPLSPPQPTTNDRDVIGLQKTTLPDGSRLYYFPVPVAAEYQERKGGFEVTILRCKDVEESGWDAEANAPSKTTRVEAHYTYANGSSGSMSSCSGNRYASDDDAITGTARRLWTNW